MRHPLRAILITLLPALSACSPQALHVLEEGPSMSLVGAIACKTADYRAVARCPDIIGRAYECESLRHVPAGEAIVWGTNPPASGTHFDRWVTRRGEYSTPVPRGNYVHNLEHGHVVLLYNCPEGCEENLAMLRRVLRERASASLLLTPDPLLEPGNVALVAWTWIHQTPEPRFEDLLCFVDQHHGLGPEFYPLEPPAGR